MRKRTIKYKDVMFQVTMTLCQPLPAPSGTDWPVKSDMPVINVTVLISTGPNQLVPDRASQAWPAPNVFFGGYLTSLWGDEQGCWRRRTKRYHQVECSTAKELRDEARVKFYVACAEVRCLIDAMRARDKRMAQRNKLLRRFRNLKEI